MKPFAREQAGYAFQRVDSVPESAPASIKLNDARSSSPLSLEYGEDDSDAFTATRPTAPSLRQLALVGALLTLAFFLGRVTHGRPPRPPAQILSAAGLCLNLALPPPNVDDGVPIAFPSRSEPRCDPYVLPGTLLMGLQRSEVRWAPIAAPLECDPEDLMSLVGESRKSRKLSFMQGRTVVVFGDSVDRFNVIEVCEFMGGKVEMIGNDHPLSPPLPVDQTSSPFNYDQRDGPGNWNNFEQSRPHVCYVSKYDFRIVQAFNFGLMPPDLDIATRAHYYPPGLFEDRFDQILKPLVNSTSLSSLAPVTPDLVSITMGFWHPFRQVIFDDVKREGLLAKGARPDSLDDIRAEADLSAARRDDAQKRMVEVLTHVHDAWGPVDGPDGKSWKTAVVWRTLHHPKRQHNIPPHRISTLDGIARRVVQQLIALSRQPGHEQEVGSQLHFDPWGALLVGTEDWFRDDIHPGPIPGSWLYGQMLLDRLRRVVEARDSA